MGRKKSKRRGKESKSPDKQGCSSSSSRSGSTPAPADENSSSGHNAQISTLPAAGATPSASPPVIKDNAPSTKKLIGATLPPITNSSFTLSVPESATIQAASEVKSTSLHVVMRSALDEASTSSGAVPPWRMEDHAAVTKTPWLDKVRGTETNNSTALLLDQFLQFLNEYRKPGEAQPFYPAEVLALNKRKCYKLEVNFDHLRSSLFKNQEYLSLVFKIVNSLDSTQRWLQPVISFFLKSHGFAGNDKTMDTEAGVNFTNKPQRIKMLIDFLQERPVKRKIGLFSNKETIEALTTHGRRTFLAVLVELLRRHRNNESYRGDFRIDNIVIVNSEVCWILKAPSPKSPHNHVVLDLNRLWTIMAYHYGNEGCLPLYLPELKDVLENANNYDVTNECFRQFLEFHPAFMSCTARRNLIHGLNNAVQDSVKSQDKKSEDPDFVYIFTARPHDPQDWRGMVNMGGRGIMSYVYFFDQDTQEPFKDTFEGLLKYSRHFLEHAKEHARKRLNIVVSSDEIELFIASKFPTLLPYLLESLLCTRTMQEFFQAEISSYQASRSDKTDLSS
ncbi:unnamed protein product [Urochloa humidicola]